VSYNLEEIERAQWNWELQWKEDEHEFKLPLSSRHLSHREFLEKRREEAFARAAEAESLGRLCIVCDGPVFYGSALGYPMTVFTRNPDPALASLSDDNCPKIADFHIHSDCAKVSPLSIRQKVEAHRLKQGRI